MGRVSRYKKIKAVDPFSSANKGRNGGDADLSHIGVWGLSSNGQRVKKRSRRSQMLRKSRGKKDGRVEGFNLPPQDEDDFDMADILGSVKKQKVSAEAAELLDEEGPKQGDGKGVVSSALQTQKLKVPSIPKSRHLPKSGDAGTQAGDRDDVNDDDNDDDNSDGSYENDADDDKDQRSHASTNGNANASSTKQKRQHQPQATIPRTEREEREFGKVLKIESKLRAMEETKVAQAHQRMPGESKNAFSRRTKAETRAIIRNEQLQTTVAARNAEKAQRKKEFLKAKKKNSKKKSRKNYDNDSGDEMDRRIRNNGNDGDDDYVRFGEQVKCPPTFQQLPRGSKKKKQQQQQSGAGKSKDTASNDARKQEMEAMRKRVQAQYALVKARRRMNR